MNAPGTPVAIRVFDKEYVVSCPPDERDSLIESARILDKSMREARDGGKAIGTERMAVMASLNIIHEMLQGRAEQGRRQSSLAAEMKRLGNKIDDALGRRADSDEIDS